MASPLLLEESLQADLKNFIGGGGTDAAIAGPNFLVLVWGSKNSGEEPHYGDSAQTVWRVAGDGQPPPELDYFDWGGQDNGLPPLRIWYVRQRGLPSRGVGAFVADGSGYPEQAELLERVGRLLRTRSCSFDAAYEDLR
jgi:hypothetical protein